MVTGTKKRQLFDPPIVRQALVDAFVKHDPHREIRNPVMFTVFIGSILTTTLGIHALYAGGQESPAFIFGVTAWLWFTVLFANFAEAVAEGRGKAQADTLRKTRSETTARGRLADGTLEDRASPTLQRDDLCVVRPGEVIPADGEVVEGIASVDESAITGESAPVIRESGGDRSAVTGGTRVLSDEIVVRITQEPGAGFIDRMIALV